MAQHEHNLEILLEKIHIYVNCWVDRWKWMQMVLKMVAWRKPYRIITITITLKITLKTSTDIYDCTLLISVQTIQLHNTNDRKAR